ncbi:hypothetical protein [Aliiglaciecola sp. M165]|uniref:hypothetical protein n=1 Tax=Aliiglaciecola sp. M165 TaxID=2593649 RepID=UPI001180A49E|nr:hypothetical protein [Aliiglaciecola sp. M165]TRY34009.1 hypothetical protein FM019_01765 [Aliiglaciecola sp. M165]
MRVQSLIGFAIVVLLVMQSFAVPVMACEMPNSQELKVESLKSTASDSHDRHMMHGDNVSTDESTHSMNLSGDCCGENCQCPMSTGFSNALLANDSIQDFLIDSHSISEVLHTVLDAHALSQFKPPIFA